MRLNKHAFDGALATISRSVHTLLNDRQKLRSELDEIV